MAARLGKIDVDFTLKKTFHQEFANEMSGRRTKKYLSVCVCGVVKWNFLYNFAAKTEGQKRARISESFTGSRF